MYVQFQLFYEICGGDENSSVGLFEELLVELVGVLVHVHRQSGNRLSVLVYAQIVVEHKFFDCHLVQTFVVPFIEVDYRAIVYYRRKLVK